MSCVDKNLYRYAEQALRNYPTERARLRLLEEFLASPIGPDEAGRVQGGEFTPEQELYLYRQCRSYEYQALISRLQAITLFLEALPPEEYKLVDLRYFQGVPWSKVAEELHITEVTCRLWRAPKIVRKAVRVILGL